MSWADRADALIAQVHAGLPGDMALADRRRALRRVASIFHGGTSWGRKVWAARSRRYLERHGQPPRRAAGTDLIFPFAGAPFSGESAAGVPILAPAAQPGPRA